VSSGDCWTLSKNSTESGLHLSASKAALETNSHSWNSWNGENGADGGHCRHLKPKSPRIRLTVVSSAREILRLWLRICCSSTVSYATIDLGTFRAAALFSPLVHQVLRSDHLSFFLHTWSDSTVQWPCRLCCALDPSLFLTPSPILCCIATAPGPPPPPSLHARSMYVLH